MSQRGCITVHPAMMGVFKADAARGHEIRREVRMEAKELYDPVAYRLAKPKIAHSPPATQKQINSAIKAFTAKGGEIEVLPAWQQGKGLRKVRLFQESAKRRAGGSSVVGI